MTQFIRQEKGSEIRYINVRSVSEATFDKSEKIMTLTYPTKNGGSHDVLLHGSEAAKAYSILESLSAQ